jgi:hypothetical protein
MIFLLHFHVKQNHGCDLLKEGKKIYDLQYPANTAPERIVITN